MQIRCDQCGERVELSDGGTHCTSCGTFLDPETTHEAFSLRATRPQLVEEASFLHYDCLELLKRNVFGETYKANDPQHSRTVVIKVWVTEEHARNTSEQLLRNARVSLHLRHPLIAQLYDAGTIGDLVYAVTEYVPGDDLGTWAKTGVASLEAARICMQLANALEHAHSSGVVHRDVKPSNVIVDRYNRPHLVDFGLARQLEGVQSSETGHVVGTPAYLSPEQARGLGSDGRSDIYSLGVVFFELLTGRRPFLGVVRDIVRNTIEVPVPAPSQLNPTVPRELELVCLKCLEKDPRDRFTSARALHDSLLEFVQSQQPVSEVEALRRELESRSTECLRLRDDISSLERTTDRRFRQLILMNDELQNRNEEFKAARELAEEATRAKSVFLAHMSHELRTPLNGILGYVQIFDRDHSLGDRQRENLAAIGSCGQHLLELINQVLSLSKIESGEIEVVSKDCDLSRLLQDVVSVVLARSDGKGLELRLDASPNLPRVIKTDETKLRQVLINLLGNAVKFTETGFIQLCAEESPANHLRLTVTDTGIGISQENLSKIFDPFSQIEGMIGAGGTGLGLAISQRLVQALEGSISVESEPGKGSCFIVSLPLVEADVPDQMPDLPSESALYKLPEGKEVTALIVDDRDHNRDILSQMLRGAGFRIVEANDGMAALCQLRKHRMPLVLMDVHMPRMNGLDATKDIKQDPELAKTVVIAVSASVFADSQQKIVEAGCDDFIGKPVRRAELFEKIERHLRVFARKDVADLPQPLSRARDEFSKEVPVEMFTDIERRFRDAAGTGNVTKLNELVEKLAELHNGPSVYIDEVRRLIKSFDFDKLLKLM